MQLTFGGKPTISATAAHIWERLMNPDVVGASTPGMQAVERLDDHHFTVYSSLGLGIVHIDLVLNAEIQNPIPPIEAGLRLHGTAHGTDLEVQSHVRLEEVGEGQVCLHWSAVTTIDGPLARLGKGILGGAARLLTERFWNDFALKAAQPVA